MKMIYGLIDIFAKIVIFLWWDFEYILNKTPGDTEGLIWIIIGIWIAISMFTLWSQFRKDVLGDNSE